MVAYHAGRADWAEAEGLALKRLFGVGEVEEATLLAQLAGVLSDDEIDAAIAAFAGFGSTAGTDKEAEANLREAKAREGDRRAAALAADAPHAGRKAPKPDLHQGFRQDGAGHRGPPCRRASRLRRPL